MNMEHSCGGIVFTIINERPHYVVVQELSGAYSFPKGHMEGNETEMETAMREVYEETSLKPTWLEGFREMDEYPLDEKPGTWKKVVYFAAFFENQPLVPTRPNEIRRVLLLPYEEALALFEHEGTRKVFEAAHSFCLRFCQKRMESNSCMFFFR